MQMSAVSNTLSLIATRAATSAQDASAVVAMASKASWVALSATHDDKKTDAAGKGASSSKPLPIAPATSSMASSATAVQSVLTALQKGGS